MQCPDQIGQFGDWQHAVIRDSAIAPQYRQGLRIEPLPVAVRTSFVDLQPLDPGIQYVVLRTGARTLLVPANLIYFQAGTVATRAPSMLGIVGKQPWIEFRKTLPAGWAGALGRKHALVHFTATLHESVERRNHVGHALAMLEREFQPFTQRLFVRGTDMQIGHRQLDGMLLETI